MKQIDRNAFLVWTLFFSCALSVQGEDTILLVTIKDNTTITQLKRGIDDAVSRSNVKYGTLRIDEISPNLYSRFVDLMNVKIEKPTVMESEVRQVPGYPNLWHIHMGDRVVPDFVWLKYVDRIRSQKPTSVDGVAEVGDATKVISEQEFRVVKSDVNDPAATAQVLNTNVVLMRTEESWDILEYGLSQENSSNSNDPKSAQKPSQFLPWPKSNPTFAVTFSEFQGGDSKRQELIEQLKSGSESYTIESPKQPVRLIAIDIIPEDAAGNGRVFGNFYLIIRDRIRDRSIKLDRQAWVLFPLDEEEKDKVLEQLSKVGEDPKSVAEFIRIRQRDYAFVDIGPTDEGAKLPGTWPGPTGQLDEQFKATWYAIPAEGETNDESARVRRFARTLRIGSAAPPATKNWAITVYAFYESGPPGDINPDRFPWRTVDLRDSDSTIKSPVYANAIIDKGIEHVRKVKK